MEADGEEGHLQTRSVQVNSKLYYAIMRQQKWIISRCTLYCRLLISRTDTRIRYYWLAVQRYKSYRYYKKENKVDTKCSCKKQPTKSAPSAYLPTSLSTHWAVITRALQGNVPLPVCLQTLSQQTVHNHWQQRFWQNCALDTHMTLHSLQQLPTTNKGYFTALYLTHEKVNDS